MVKTRTILILLVILVGFTSVMNLGLYFINYDSMCGLTNASMYALGILLMQIELVLITVLLIRYRSSIKEVQSES